MPNPNELSRLQTVVAAVDSGTFAIDPLLRTLGNHEDLAVAGGRTYSNKAPGLALAALPVYRLLRFALPSPSCASEPIFPILRFLDGIARVRAGAGTAGRRLAQGSAASRSADPFRSGLGTPLVFLRAPSSHARTAALLFLAWDLPASGGSTVRRVDLVVVAAGLLAGWAAISEYSVAPIALLLCIRAAADRAWRTAIIFTLGAAIAGHERGGAA